MTSRERVIKALSHKETDRVPKDLSGTIVSGINVSALTKLRIKLGMEKKIVKVFEPMTMQGRVDFDVLNALGCDIIGLYSPYTFLGFKNENWKPWTLPDKTEVLVAGGFNYTYGNDGSIFLYPNGDTSVAPSAKMPSTGYFFDNIYRQKDLTNHKYDARKDYEGQFSIFSDDECQYYEKKSKELFEETDYAIFGNFFQGGVGDVFGIPGAWLKEPKGIRDLSLWFMAHYERPDYIKEMFDMQIEVALKNLELYRQALGDRIVAIGVCATDFGTQNGPLMSLDSYRELYKPYHKKINDWIHRNTGWKTFKHTCGSILDFMDDFIEAGFDIINPVQFNAAKMDVKNLKDKYGDRISFWGGGANSQWTLPFGTPDEVEEEVKMNVKVLSKGGGYIAGTVHNIQGLTPPENIIAFFKAINS